MLEALPRFSNSAFGFIFILFGISFKMGKGEYMLAEPLAGITKSDVIYRSLGDDLNTGIISCGFMKKEGTNRSQRNFTIGYYSCFVLLSGSGTYSDENGNVTQITPGDLVQRIPGVLHSTEVKADGKWLEFYISFGKPVYEYLAALDLLHTDKPVFRTIYTTDDIEWFANFLSKLREADSAQLPKLLLEAQELVLYLHKRSNQWSTPIEQNIKIACQLLSSHFDQDIPMETIADSVHMGYEHFRKIFRGVTGISPAKYRIKQRINNAQILLQSGKSIKETALLSGYEDCYSFSKQFKQVTGIPPGKFRRQ
jgi:AraC family transcriptional regulator, arabinose operon regulatory protein